MLLGSKILIGKLTPTVPLPYAILSAIFLIIEEKIPSKRLRTFLSTHFLINYNKYLYKFSFIFLNFSLNYIDQL